MDILNSNKIKCLISNKYNLNCLMLAKSIKKNLLVEKDSLNKKIHNKNIFWPQESKNNKWIKTDYLIPNFKV
jgi:hypothetical protein